MAFYEKDTVTVVGRKHGEHKKQISEWMEEEDGVEWVGHLLDI